MSAPLARGYNKTKSYFEKSLYKINGEDGAAVPTLYTQQPISYPPVHVDRLRGCYKEGTVESHSYRNTIPTLLTNDLSRCDSDQMRN
jgi:hypothetical protein